MQPVAPDPGASRLDDHVSLRRFLAVKNAHGYVDNNSSVWNPQRLVLFDPAAHRVLESCEVALVADERLDERVLDRHRLPVGSCNQRFNRAIGSLIESVDLRTSHAKFSQADTNSPMKVCSFLPGLAA
jgi:hypothetical protein